MSIRAKRISLSIATIFALAIGWFLVRAITRPAPTPPIFVSGRTEIAATAARIVSLTGEVHRIVELIGAAERAGARDKTRALIEEAEAKNNEAHNEAVALTEKLKVAATSLGSLPSATQRRLALEAVSGQLALAGEYLSYTGAFSRFIETLRGTIGASTSPEALTKALEEVNASVARINEVNRLAIEKMRELDESL